MPRYYISRDGYKKLLEKRQGILTEIEIKRKHMIESFESDNDIRENPEFMRLRTELTYVLPKRLGDTDAVISSCSIIEDSREFIDSTFEQVQPGAKVTIQYANGSIVTFLILGYEEANLDENIISYLSPIAKSLLGKRVDETVEFESPQKTVQMKIIKIEKGI